MERFHRLFSNLLVFVYHYFDRIVINGYLNGLSRAGGSLCSRGPRHSGVVDLRGGNSTYQDGNALRNLYANREMVAAVATQTKGILAIPDQAGPFTLSKESLRAEFPTAPAPSPTPSGTGR
ncbi:MAG TPA: hypothetical protein VM120_02075 [Bryobacteraceae bacterium]|nr:hypothetical protein [Bryobacteraceae bacterium]